MKGAPAKILLVHGTWGRGFDPDKDARRRMAGNAADPRWFEAGSQFRVALSSGLSGLIQATDISAFHWSGANSIEERRGAAVRLAKTLDESVAAAPEARHFIIAHSHGGNVALDARRAMSGNAFNVHIVTLATPFLSIYQRMNPISQRLLPIILSLGLAGFASGVWSYVWIDLFDALLVAFGLNCLISLCSILFGAVTFFCSADPATQKKQLFSRLQADIVDSARRINNQSLLASSFLFAAAWLSLGFGVATVQLPFSLPTLLLFFFFLPRVRKAIYGNQNGMPRTHQNIPNLTILRSKLDEASLSLFFGKVASYLAQVTSSISILVPIATTSLVALLVYYTVDFSLSQIHLYQECVTLGKNCSIQGEKVGWLIFTALDLGAQNFRFFAIGFCVCGAFILLAGSCKSFFGRELLYRSINVFVNAHDTPDGLKSYSVDWCAPLKESVFGLRHSLYNNPDAVNKIIRHIAHVCAAGANQEAPTVAVQPYKAPRNGIWSTAAALAFVVSTYAIAVLLVYAPPGATSRWCALNSYFEPAGLKGGFTILVAGFENDLQSVGDSLAKEISNRYGLHVIRTCVLVTENWEDRSSADKLLLGYNSDLVLWGKAGKSGEVKLHVRRLHQQPDENMPIMLTESAIPEFVEKQLQSHLFLAIDDSSYRYYESVPPANLADHADRVEAFVQSVDWSMGWSDDRSEGVTELYRLIDKVRMHYAVSRLMLVAAQASDDGLRVKKAIAYFVRASSIIDSSEELRELSPGFFSDRSRDEYYMSALLTDARLNKAEDSAKAAASMYLEKYEEAVARREVWATNDQLRVYAEEVASAVSELYSITHSQDDANTAIRFACESMLRLRYWRVEREQLEKRDAALHQRGLQRGILTEVKAPEQTEAYKILVRFGKDPFTIFAPGSELALEGCKTF